jgi:DNA polymerase-3 subunit delta
MTPDQLLAQIDKTPPAPVYLFIGPETWQRDACRRALVERHLAPEEREHGFTRHDLDERTMAEILDDARSLSLFAPRRLLWVSSAESALPKGRAAASDEEGEPSPGPASAEVLAAYLKDPTPGVVVVFDARKHEFEGDDKAKAERVRRFYGAVGAVVEFARLGAAATARLARKLAREAGLTIGEAELDLLVEAVGADASRIALEIAKLRLFQREGTRIGAGDIAALVPSAHAASIFELVDAIASGDRAGALALLDALVREGEYLPLALTFLATQLRQSLAARELELRGAGQIVSHFSRHGVAMWPSRAQQIERAATRSSTAQLEAAVRRVFQADFALRDARPDDRIIMEEFVLAVTGESKP